jgi:hypothetical protein
MRTIADAALEALRTHESFFTANPEQDTRPSGLINFTREVLSHAEADTPRSQTWQDAEEDAKERGFRLSTTSPPLETGPYCITCKKSISQEEVASHSQNGHGICWNRPPEFFSNVGESTQ